MNEIWRPIAGRPGYEVSDRGRVRSLDRVITKMQRGRIVYAKVKGRVLSPGRARSGYLVVGLGKRETALSTGSSC
jgi:hypothetical protein